MFDYVRKVLDAAIENSEPLITHPQCRCESYCSCCSFTTSFDMRDSHKLHKFIPYIYDDNIVLLGAGVSRIVVYHKDQPDIVYKYQYGSGSQQYGGNQTEWDRYHEMDESYHIFFAKPLQISEDGIMMSMERVDGSTVYYIENETDDYYDDTDYYRFRNNVSEIEINGQYIFDLHKNNIMINKRGEFVVVDYAG